LDKEYWSVVLITLAAAAEVAVIKPLANPVVDRVEAELEELKPEPQHLECLILAAEAGLVDSLVEPTLAGQV
jgi:hypothetical protein